MIELQVNDQRFVGWSDVNVVRSLDQAVSTFSFTATQHPENTQSLKPGTACEVLFEREKIITGIVDRVEVDYDAKNHLFHVFGRSATKDLVDCSTLPPYQFKGMSVKNMVSKIAEIYNVVVTGGDDSTIINNFQIETNGESCFSSIQRIVETKAFRITDTPNGELFLTQASKTKTQNVIDGTKVLSAKLSLDESNKYSKIIVKGQSRATDTGWGKKHSQIVASAEDETINRKRELIIRAENDASTADAQKLANWEIASRSARGLEISYTLQGWKGTAGQLWFENQLVQVNDSVFQINDEFLITKVEYKLNKQGTVVTLLLADPEAYTPKPKITKKSQKKVLGW